MPKEELVYPYKAHDLKAGDIVVWQNGNDWYLLELLQSSDPTWFGYHCILSLLGSPKTGTVITDYGLGKSSAHTWITHKF